MDENAKDNQKKTNDVIREFDYLRHQLDILINNEKVSLTDDRIIRISKMLDEYVIKYIKLNGPLGIDKEDK